MNFYFTSVPINSREAEFLATHPNGCVLLSQLNERQNILQWVDKLKNHPENSTKLFIDSGAFSAWTKGTSIDIDEYINFINTYRDYFDICASVDVIPGSPRSASVPSVKETQIAAQKSWDNFIYMRNHMIDVDKVLYTFHIGEPWEYLKKALSYKDNKGKINYIALGGLVGKIDSDVENFLDEAFSIIQNSENPNIKVHTFGMTRFDYMESYHIYSTDSTAYIQKGAFGGIVIGTKTVQVSSQSSLESSNLLQKNTAVYNEVIDVINKRGFTLEELQNSRDSRVYFNCISYYEYMKNYKYTPKMRIQPISLF